jgi:hypothetical protein
LHRYEWRSFLKRWSEEWIVVHDPLRDPPLADGVLQDQWLGFPPATEDQIAAAERRLGRSLPPSLREFLLVTSGWRDAGDFIHRLAGAEELAWLRETDDDHWIDAYSGWGDPDHGEVLRRSLRLSLAGDAAVLLLDPEDVDDDGEWAAYWLASWSGTGPQRHRSFYDVMQHLYAAFHALRKPPGRTREEWDARVEQARRAALDGDIEGPLAVLEQAQAFGRDRAALLRFQLRAMLGDWYSVRLAHLVLSPDRSALLADPIFAGELLPLLFVEDRLTHRLGHLTLDRLTKVAPAPIQRLIADHAQRLATPDFRLSFGTPQFDAAVHEVLERLTAQPAFSDPDAFRPPSGAVAVSSDQTSGQRERQRLIDEAWPRLLEAMTLWRPLSETHIAPVVLFADPILAQMITPERGRAILSVPRG